MGYNQHMNLIKALDTRAGAILAAGALALAVVVYLRDKANQTIKASTDSAANWWVGLDGYVEFSDFTIARLYRDNFDHQWQMLPDVYALYNKMYPKDMAVILDVDRVLKPEFRGQISL